MQVSCPSVPIPALLYSYGCQLIGGFCWFAFRRCFSFVNRLLGWIAYFAFTGDYLAIATLGMSEIIRVVFINIKITNGAAGLVVFPGLQTGFLYLFVVSTIVLISNFLKSSHGRACISIREDEIAAEAMGINTTRYKVMSFTMGAFLPE